MRPQVVIPEILYTQVTPNWFSGWGVYICLLTKEVMNFREIWGGIWEDFKVEEERREWSNYILIIFLKKKTLDILKNGIVFFPSVCTIPGPQWREVERHCYWIHSEMGWVNLVLFPGLKFLKQKGKNKQHHIHLPPASKSETLFPD